MEVDTIKFNGGSVEINGEIYDKRIKPESKFKIGNWVYWDGNCPTFGRIAKHCNGFADSWALDNTGKSDTYTSCSEAHLRLATRKEIDVHLRKIILEKYVGKTIKCLRTGNVVTVVTEEYNDGYSHTWSYDFENDVFNVAIPQEEWGMTSNPTVYDKGRWAERVAKKPLPQTKEELKSLLIAFDEWHSPKVTKFLKEY